MTSASDFLLLPVKRLDEAAKLPTRNHSEDAGLDLYALENAPYRPGELIKVRTGIAMAIPKGHVGLILDRSGVATKKQLKVMGGVIDAPYRGEVIVALQNLSGGHGCVQAGDRCAQIVILPIALMYSTEVDTLDETSRGDKGFGSSGN